jgi:hypothetical protein
MVGWIGWLMTNKLGSRKETVVTYITGIYLEALSKMTLKVGIQVDRLFNSLRLKLKAYFVGRLYTWQAMWGGHVKLCFFQLLTEALKAIIAQNELRGKIMNPSCYKLRLNKMRIKRLNGCHSSWSQSRLWQDIRSAGGGNISCTWYGAAVYGIRYMPLYQFPFSLSRATTVLLSALRLYMPMSKSKTLPVIGLGGL